MRWPLLLGIYVEGRDVGRKEKLGVADIMVACSVVESDPWRWGVGKAMVLPACDMEHPRKQSQRPVTTAQGSVTLVAMQR